MRLVDLVSKETGADSMQIMLLRHSNADMDRLSALGGSVEEYTSLQPTDSKYDYRARGKPRIDVVVVIVHDRVFGVYRIVGVEREGTIYSLASDAHRQLAIEGNRGDRRGRRFRMARLPCTADGAMVTGWEGRQRTPVARSDGTFFWDIEVDLPERAPIDVEVRDLTDTEIDAALQDGRLRFGMVPTSSPEAVARQRRGQDRLRALTLENYGGRCALCDVSDERLLMASHIVGWAEREETRGDLDNAICLCSFHDALFENGYWSLDDRLGIVVRSDIDSATVRALLPAGCSFRKPSEHPPRLEFIRHHRMKRGLASSRGRKA